MIILCMFEILFFVIISSILKEAINLKDIKKFNENYKKIFVLKSLEKIFDNIIYNPNSGFDETFVKNVSMTNTADSYRTNDYISGTYKEIKFEQSDIHIIEKREERDSDGNTSTVWVTIFKGRLMVFDFNKKFKSNIKVSSNNFMANRILSKNKYKNVKTEDIKIKL